MDGKFLPMKVIDADGTKRTVMSITNDVDDTGNAIAEGRMQEAERFIELSRCYKIRFIRVEKELLEERRAKQKAWWTNWYNDNWTNLFCEPWQQETEP